MPWRILIVRGGQLFNLNRIINFATEEEANERRENLLPWEDEVAGDEENESTDVQVIDEDDHVYFQGTPDQADAFIASLDVHEIDNIPKNNRPNGPVSFEDEPFMPHRPHPADEHHLHSMGSSYHAFSAPPTSRRGG